MKFSLKYFQKLDWFLIALIVLLITTGLILIYSTSFKADQEPDFNNFLRQIIYAAVGLILMLGVAIFNYRGLRNITNYLYIFSVLSLAVVLILGKTISGSMRWIDFGIFHFQPSEITKLILIIILAKYLADHLHEMKFFRHLLLSGIYVAIPTILVLLEPDLGTALSFVAIWIVMLIIAGARALYLLLVGAGIGGAIPIAWFFIFKDYQKERLASFLNPQSDPLGSGYNIVQSTIAIGSGRIFGRGLGYGPQSHLNFLPVQHTDFVFAVLAEELGFLGGLFLLLLFAFLLWRILKVILKATDNFGRLLGVGILTITIIQILVNIGMNLGIMPITGIPLPLVSYGGSALLFFMLSFGIILSIGVNKEKIEFNK